MFYIDNLNKIIKNLNEKNTDLIIVISSFHKSFVEYRSIDKIETIKSIFNFLKEKTYNKMLLMYPAFTHSFVKSGIFNVKKTRPEQMGALPLLAFKDDDFYRTLSPINSFLVWPKDIKLEKKFISSTFGNHSIFDWMTSKKCRIICLGDISDTQNGWIGAHHSEQICKVPYRYYKKFSGKIIDRNHSVFNHTQYHFARIEKLNIKNDFSFLNKKLREKNMIDEIYSDQLNISTVWLNDVIKISNQIIKKDPYGLTNFK